MSKREKYANFHGSGYTMWDIRRTIREAENVARWKPWLGHSWMEEALNQITLDNPFYSEYNSAVDRINDRWILLRAFDWFNEGEFWKHENGEPGVITLLESI